jgi:hypothetical protein
MAISTKMQLPSVFAVCKELTRQYNAIVSRFTVCKELTRQYNAIVSRFKV